MRFAAALWFVCVRAVLLPGQALQHVCVLVQAKWQLTCYLCQQRYGACIQCAGSNKCFLAFHPSCARSAGLLMETVEPGSDYETSEAESEGEAPATHSAVQYQTGLDENQDTLNVPICKVPQADGSNTIPATASKGCPGGVVDGRDAGANTPGLPSAQAGTEKVKGGLTSVTARKRRKRSGAPMQEGTYIGGGRRMMCYCPKHSHMAQTPAGTSHQRTVPAAAATASGASSAAEAAVDTSLPHKHRQAQQQSAPQQASSSGQSNWVPDGQPKAHQLPGHKAGCIREVPFNHACRRGQREPDAVAAALAKRLFVAKTPYIISGPCRHGQHQMPLAHRHATEAPFLMDQASSGHRLADSGRSQATAKTQTQRFKEMQQTVGRRLTCGKSAIHGLGAFTKKAHAAGTHWQS